MKADNILQTIGGTPHVRINRLFGDTSHTVWIKSEPDTRETLIQADPDTFFVPPYVGPRGWIGVEVDGDVDWALVAGLLEEGYRSVAPKRALEQLDG